ncbi:hypothetical protein C8T65DRAFT_738526 [Cerioporus squamosus]|nr:hypothetical protein C8T65DRAFT_738526 [Cerioporus squamosus]
MPTNYSRDTRTQPLLPSHQCRPISPSFRFCAGDITALVVAAVSIWYIVWGIPLTIRCYKFLSATFKAYRRRSVGSLEDPEKTADEDEGKEDHVDPFSTRTSGLWTHLHAYKDLAIPAPVHSPFGNPDASRSHRSSPVELPSHSPSGVLFTSSSRSSLSRIYSPASTHSDNLVFNGSNATSPELGKSGNSGIATILPASPPLAHMGQATGSTTATCKPSMW